MAAFIFLLSAFVFIWLMEKLLSIIVKFLYAGKAFMRVLRMLILVIILIGIFFFPEDFGRLLYPVLHHFKFFIEWLLDLIWEFLLKDLFKNLSQQD
jgi:hypothetical protein